MTIRISTAQARKDFARVLRRASAEGERVKLTRYNKTMAVLVPRKDLSILEECERQPRPRSRNRTR